MNDSTTKTDFYASLTRELVQRSSRAVVSYLSPLSPGLRVFLRQHLDKIPGAEGSFLADPVFEATFGWKEHPENMDALAGKLLDPALVDSMDAATADRFKRSFFPYTHQVEAWETLQCNPPQSVVVSSGTGSGKTECFLVPILDSLARQRVQGQALKGVQALFLYPLNALINSQRDRLRAWTAGFEGDIKFCLYNGQTPKQDPPVTETRKYPQEVMGRPSLRKAPPPILITNATMLEYMLVRQDDAPIIERSKGRLKWIVLDEAHTYVGSQAAEISLLLRRVLHAFEVEPEQVRFIATSATIGKKGDAKTRAQLQEYLAKVAGLPKDRVHVIEGSREVPQLPQALERKSKPLPNLDDVSALTPAQRYSTLAAVDSARKLRAALAKRPEPVKHLAQEVFGGDGWEELSRTLRLLDVARTAMDGETPFLPLRGHLFHRTQPGLWACVNPNCSNRQSQLEQGWPFGRVFLAHRQKCTQGCGSLVFELVMCRRCGVEYLGCESGENHANDGRPRLSAVGLQDADTDDDDSGDAAENTDEVDPSVESDSGPERQLIRWVAAPALEGQAAVPIELNVLNGEWSERSNPKIGGFFMSQWLPSGSRCPRCGEHEYSRGDMLRTMNLGAPFLLGVSTPTLLEHVPAKESALTRPINGRRLITFSDSRQGTARFALKLQIEAERNFVRSYLYHSVQSRIVATSSESDLAMLKSKEEMLALPGIPDHLRAITQKEVQDLRTKLSAPAVGKLPWRDAVEGLAHSNALQYWILPAWKNAGRAWEPKELAEFLIVREVARRPMRQNSVETLGLVQVEYPEIADAGASGLPSAVSREGLTPEEWRSLLKLLLDLIVRGNTAIVIDPDWTNWMGTRISPKVILGPHADKAERNKKIRWPQIRKGNVRSRFVKLLAHALVLNLDEAEDRARINELLLAAWVQIRGLLLKGDGYRLDFSKSVTLTSIENAWICPTTRRVLDTTLRGYTPYIPREVTGSLVCEPVIMPRLEHPFPESGDSTGRTISAESITTWLESEPQIKACREQGIWTDFSDRIASYAPYY